MNGITVREQGVGEMDLDRGSVQVTTVSGRGEGVRELPSDRFGAKMLAMAQCQSSDSECGMSVLRVPSRCGRVGGCQLGAGSCELSPDTEHLS